ncbi:MAG: FHA domain-containing protein [Pseudomonadota bacterium]
MAKIIVTMDGTVLQELTLSKERTTIGRRPQNDVIIDNLAISGQHAVIVTIMKDSFLEDLNSTNGTMVNGQPIKKHFLQDKDVIELAKYKITFIDEARRAALLAQGDKQAEPTMSLASDSPASHSIKAATPPAEAVTDNREGRIKVMNGASAGKEMALSKPQTSIGRPGVQVAVITRQASGYFITHVEGASFPLINGQSIGAGARKMQNGDLIELSGTRMAFSI